MAKPVEDLYDENCSTMSIPLPAFKKGDHVVHAVAEQVGSVGMSRYDLYSGEWYHLLSLSVEMQYWVSESCLKRYKDEY